MRVSVSAWMSTVSALGALALGLGAAGAAGATTIDFDDIANADGGAIAAGYGGFDWRNFDSLNTVDFAASNGPSGYSNAAVTSPNVALNGFGQAAAFSSAATFTLNDLYLTGAWMDGLSVQITGFAGGVQVDSATRVIDTSAPTHVVLNWTGLDKVAFVASGGTPHGFTDKSGVPGEQFALDNLTVNGPIVSAPEPTTWAMLVLGMGALGLGVRRRRSRAAAGA